MKSLIAFFWPFGAYRDADHGSLMERAAAWRYNRQLALELPRYINRWAVCSAVLLILMDTVPPPLVPLIALMLTLAVCALLHLLRVWLSFRRRSL